MADFILIPENDDGLLEPSTRQLRLTTGLAPTADASTSARSKPEPPPCYAPCATCSALTLVGVTATGARLVLDTGIRTYTVHWQPGAPQPLLFESRGYPIHRCHPQPQERGLL